MVEALLSVAVIAGVVVGVAAGPAWGVVAFGVIVAAQISLWLERIARDLRTVRGFVQWFRVLESHRFGKQYPNAAAEWEADREAERQAARKTEGPAAVTGPSVFRAEVQPEYPTPPSSASGSKTQRPR